MTVRVTAATKKRLERLATATDRTPSFLASDAIESYLELQEWQVEAIRAGVKEADSGQVVSHESVEAWIRSWAPKR